LSLSLLSPPKWSSSASRLMAQGRILSLSNDRIPAVWPGARSPGQQQISLAFAERRVRVSCSSGVSRAALQRAQRCAGATSGFAKSSPSCAGHPQHSHT
jgi:hypothetical protein